MRLLSPKFYGAVEGTLISLSAPGQQPFGILSSAENKIIQCCFKEEMFGEARKALSKRVYVFGLLYQSVHLPKISIQVEELRVLPSADEHPTIAELSRMLNGENTARLSTASPGEV